MTQDHTEDLKAVTKAMYKALCWTADNDADWDQFRALFHGGAKLVPSARPAGPIDVETFIGRMQGQKDNGSLTDFFEEKVSEKIEVFGSIATIFSTYRTLMNKEREARGINALVLVKEEEGWKIASMVWDGESGEKPLPARYVA